MLKGARSAGSGADPKAIGEALWNLVLGRLDARLPGELCPFSGVIWLSPKLYALLRYL